MGSPNLNTVVLSLVLLILFFVLSLLVAVSSETNEEADALLKWKASLQIHNRSLLSSWIKDTSNVSSKISPCAWSGISCNDAGRVINISLRGVGLKGKLHDFSFSSFPHLAYLDLRNNKLFGTIPPQISNLTNLSIISLGGNQFSGNIPPEVGLMSHLKILYIDSNQLDGSIPLEVGQLSSMVELALFSNNLNGSVPHSLGNLTQISMLFLHDNSFSGFIPPDIGNLKSISILSLAINQFSGPIPLSLGNLTNLKQFSLVYNNLSGSIPPSLDNLVLTKLSLDDNHFTNYLPQNICRGGALQIFTVSENHFQGTIPKSLRNCTSLIRVRLDGNNLTGNISKAFGIYPNLTFIDLSRVENSSCEESKVDLESKLACHLSFCNLQPADMEDESGLLSWQNSCAEEYQHISMEQLKLLEF